MDYVELGYPPQDRDSLWLAVQVLFGVTIPRTRVCPDHCAPFDAFADAYFGVNTIDGPPRPITRAIWHGCLPAGTQVRTGMGPRPIEKIVPGDRVLGWKDGSLGWGTVSRAWQASPSAQVFALRTRAGELRATANHPVLIARKYKGRPGDGVRRRPPNEWREEFVRLDEVTADDFLVQPFGHEPEHGDQLEPDLAEWLGLLCGDGFINLNSVTYERYGTYYSPRVQIAHHPRAGYMDHYRDFVQRRYGKQLHYNARNYCSSFASRAAYEEAICFEGKRALTKTVPPQLWGASRECVLAFLRGYLDSDGTVRTRDGSIEWSSANSQLLHQVRELCLMHGLRTGRVSRASVAGQYEIRGRLIQRRDLFTLRCYDGIEIGTNDPKYDFGTRKKRSLSKRNAWAAPMPKPDRRYLKVLQIQPLGCEPVWDLSVDDVGSFTADGFLVHNSRGLAGKSQSLSILGLAFASLTGSEVTVLGGSMAQSSNVHNYMTKATNNEGLPRDFVLDITATRIMLANRSKLTPIPASHRTVRSPHTPKLLIDEADEMDLDIYDAAQGIPMPQLNAKGERIPTMTVVSSTWQHADGTFTEIMRRAEKAGDPIYRWCHWETANEVDGWLTPDVIEEKKRSVTAAMWAAEYELQEPSIGNRAFDTAAVEAAFSLPFEPIRRKEGKDFEEYTFARYERGAVYVAGADWAKENDKTVLVVVRVDQGKRELVWFHRVNRRPYPVMIEAFNKAVNRYRIGRNGVWHDSTGLGNVVNDYLDTRARPFQMTGDKRAKMLSDFVNAIEKGTWALPRIPSAYREMKYAKVGDLYKPVTTIGHTGQSKALHLPDTVCALALAEYAARRVVASAAPQVVERDERPTKLQAAFAHPEGEHVSLADQQVRTPTDIKLTV